jgi:hypothetical protein
MEPSSNTCFLCCLGKGVGEKLLTVQSSLVYVFAQHCVTLLAESPMTFQFVLEFQTIDVFRSIWMVVSALRNIKDFGIIIPTCHSKQQMIANEFKAKSTFGF